MRRIVFFVIAVVAALAVSGASGLTGSVQARWVIRDLGPLASLADEDVASIRINDRGAVVWNGRTKTGSGHAFLWKDGNVRDLGTLPGGNQSWVSGVNDRGQVAGTAVSGDDFHAFLWENGSMRDLGTLPGGRSSSAAAINAGGEVVGSADTNGWDHAFLWTGGTIRDLGTLGGRKSLGKAISDRVQVVGSRETQDGERHAFSWQNGRMRDLGAGDAWALNESGLIIGVRSSGGYWKSGKFVALRVGGLTMQWKVRTPIAVNRRGQIVGNYERPKAEGEWTSWLRACLWDTRSGRVRDLGTLGGETARVYGINDSGQVVGTSRTPNGVRHAFLWANGRMTDLDD